MAASPRSAVARALGHRRREHLVLGGLQPATSRPTTCLRLGLVAVQNPEDRNLVMQEKSPSADLREALLNYYRRLSRRVEEGGADGEGSARRNLQNRDDDAEEGARPLHVRAQARLCSRGCRAARRLVDSRWPRASRRQPVLRFNNGETFDDAIDHLNQWIATRPGSCLPPLPDQPPPAKWTPDPLVQALPADLRNLRVIYSIFNELPALKFNRELNFPATHDGWRLQEVAPGCATCRRADEGSRRSARTGEEALRLDRALDPTAGRPWAADGDGQRRDARGRSASHAVAKPAAAREGTSSTARGCSRCSRGSSARRRSCSNSPTRRMRPSRRSGRPACCTTSNSYPLRPSNSRARSIPGPGARACATIAQAAADPSVLTALDLPGRPIRSVERRGEGHRVHRGDPAVSRRARASAIGPHGANQLVLTVNPSRIAFDLKADPRSRRARIWSSPHWTIRVTVGDARGRRRAIRSRARPSSPSLPEPNSRKTSTARCRRQADMWCARVADLKGKFIGGARAGGDSDDLAVSAERRRPTRCTSASRNQLAARRGRRPCAAVAIEELLRVRVAERETRRREPSTWASSRSSGRPTTSSGLQRP